MKTSETNLEINSTKHFNVDAFIDSWDGSEEALEKLSEEEWKLFWDSEVEEVNKKINALIKTRRQGSNRGGRKS